SVSPSFRAPNVVRYSRNVKPHHEPRGEGVDICLACTRRGVTGSVPLEQTRRFLKVIAGELISALGAIQRAEIVVDDTDFVMTHAAGSLFDCERAFVVLLGEGRVVLLFERAESDEGGTDFVMVRPERLFEHRQRLLKLAPCFFGTALRTEHCRDDHLILR